MNERNHQKRHKTQVNWSQPGNSTWPFLFSHSRKVLHSMEKLQRNPKTLPVVTYASEIWGYKVHNCIEAVLLKLCRIQLGVGSKSPTPAVLGECGRYGVYVHSYLK